MKYCSKCEGKLIEGLKYCFNCGADVEKAENHKKGNKKGTAKKGNHKSRLDTRLFDII